jgi:hypothetical protein
MYNIRTEKDYTIRTYTAGSYFDAVDLFHNLSKVLPFVQVWQGDELVLEYDPRKEEYKTELHIAQHYMK